MAIATVNAVFSGTGPTKDKQILASMGQGPQGQALYGIATATGDGASSTFTVNFIDGTAALSFTPSLILCQRVGGAATATISVVSAVVVDAKTFTVNTSATVNAATFIVGFVAIP